MTNSIVMAVGISLCEKFSLTVKELIESLDAFLCNTDASTLTNDNMGKFEQHIMQSQTKV